MSPNQTLTLEKSARKNQTSSKTPTSSSSTAMRVIVPLQGVVQGRGGLVLGSIIPCALFYFFQLYLKSRNGNNARSPSSSRSSSSSSENLAELANDVPPIIRTPSRSHLLSPRGSGPASISARAGLIASPNWDSAYYVGMRRCGEDLYDRVKNPEGFMQLGVAKSSLMEDMMGEWLRCNLGKVEGLNISGMCTYQPFDGIMDLKIAFADFMGRVMGGDITFNPSQLILTAGASAAIEALGFCLADPGNAFLVPSPYYPGFDRDIKLRTGIELIPVPCRSTDNFSISTDALERAYNQARKRGVKVRAVLITNPSNPVGNILNEETLYDLLDFITDKNIHLISDEIAAGETYGHDEFISVLQVLEQQHYDKSRVHVIYGLSKVLSVPGFRVGAVYSYNENVLAAATKYARFCSIPVLMQRLVVSMLSDTAFIKEFVEVGKERLRKINKLFVDGLKRLGIECCVNSSAGSFCWADMSKFIKPYSEKGEIELWERLLTVAKVNFTPGSSCYCIEPGWFRCTFAVLTEDDIPVVMERISRVIKSDSIQ